MTIERTFTIFSDDGTELGAYVATTCRDAIEAYCRDAGYASRDAAEKVDPTVAGLQARPEYAGPIDDCEVAPV